MHHKLLSITLYSERIYGLEIVKLAHYLRHVNLNAQLAQPAAWRSLQQLGHIAKVCCFCVQVRAGTDFQAVDQTSHL